MLILLEKKVDYVLMNVSVLLMIFIIMKCFKPLNNTSLVYENKDSEI